MEDASPAAPAAPMVRSRGGKPLLVLVLLVVAATLSWWAWQRWSPPDEPATAPVAAPAPSPDGPPTTTPPDAVREQLADLTRVNAVLRQQVLALTERVRVLGDQVTALERAPADRERSDQGPTPVLALAEQWLELAQARFDLFDDVRGALTALDAADRVLARARDPRVRSLRQTLGIEREALRGLPQADTLAVSGQLQAWQQASAGWPLRHENAAARTATTTADGLGGWLSRLDRYFTVRRLEPGTPPLRMADGRALIAAELAWARLLLMRGERAELQGTLMRIADTITDVCDGSDEGVATALEGIRSLAQRVLGGTHAPRLGATLAELQGFSGERGAEPATPAPASAPPTVEQPPEAPDTPEQAVEPAPAAPPAVDGAPP